MTSIVVPNWMNLLSLPVLLVVLLTLNYCAAVWMQPTHVPNFKNGVDTTTKGIFLLLTAFSAVGLVTGLFLAETNATPTTAIIVQLAIFVALGATLLTRKIWLVGAICYETAFFIGETIVNYNALFAILLTIIMVVIILILAITVGPLSFIKSR